MPDPDLPIAPRLRHSPLFWGGLLVVVFLLFLWAASLRHRASLKHFTAMENEIALFSWQSGLSYESLSVTATLDPSPPGPGWVWKIIKPPTYGKPLLLFPLPHWQSSHYGRDGALFATGAREFYDVRERTILLPYWLLLAIVTPLWLLALHRSRRRFRRTAAAPLPPAAHPPA